MTFNLVGWKANVVMLFAVYGFITFAAQVWHIIGG